MVTGDRMAIEACGGSRGSIHITIDGLNVLCRSEGWGGINRWEGLIGLLSIFHSISAFMEYEISLTTVIRQTAKRPGTDESNFLRAVSRLSRLIILSDITTYGCDRDGEVDDHVVMSLTKTYGGYFVSHDYRMQEHIGESKEWAEDRRITMSFEPAKRGVSLNIPEGSLNNAYYLFRGDGERRSSVENASEVGAPPVGGGFPSTVCLVCNLEIGSEIVMKSHARRTGHIWFRGYPERITCNF